MVQAQRTLCVALGSPIEGAGSPTATAATGFANLRHINSSSDPIVVCIGYPDAKRSYALLPGCTVKGPTNNPRCLSRRAPESPPLHTSMRLSLRR